MLAGLLLACGAGHAQITVTRHEALKLTVYEFEAGQMRMEVLSSAALKTTDMRADQGVAVRRALTLPKVDLWRRHEMLLVSGGYATNPSDRPDGLLISNGDAGALPSQLTLKGDRDNKCIHRREERLKLSGLLCVAKDGQTRIGRFSDAAAADCYQARQSGPLLVENGQAAVCPRDPEGLPSNRTVVCTAGTRVKFIVSSAPVDLFELSQWLVGDPKAPRCNWALNLSDGNSSGSLYTPRKAHQLGKKESFVGPGSYPVASFIAVHAR